jgi:hypothetical protein
MRSPPKEAATNQAYGERYRAADDSERISNSAVEAAKDDIGARHCLLGRRIDDLAIDPLQDLTVQWLSHLRLSLELVCLDLRNGPVDDQHPCV